VADLNVTAEFLESLTIEDIEIIEDVVGVAIDDIFGGTKTVPKGKLLKAIAFVVNRKTDPEFTLEAAGKMTMTQISALLEAAGVAAQIPLPVGNGSSS
jgi:hypothetical protein